MLVFKFTASFNFYVSIKIKYLLQCRKLIHISHVYQFNCNIEIHDIINNYFAYTFDIVVSQVNSYFSRLST